MATEQPAAFGDVLRRYRQMAGLTQEALAERAHVSWRVISDLERGVTRAPRRETVRLLAEALTLSDTTRTHFEAAARRGAGALLPPVPSALPAPVLPPFVGRATEVALLERHLRGEGAPLLLLAGEPGIGKTRLLHEAARGGAAQGLRVLHGGCRQRGGQEPYAPVLDALARRLRSLPPAQTRVELRGCAWLVRLLPELAAGPIEPLPAWTLPPEHERRLMFEAVVRFLGNAAGPAGTALLLDDLQWAGADALALLRALAHSATEIHLRVVGAYRDTDIAASDPLATLLADLAHAGLAAQHDVAPLPPADARRLLATLWDTSALPRVTDATGAAQARVLERAGGVPFFLVSCAQALTRDVPPGTDPRATLPWDVAQTVRQRVAALPAPARELVGVAAVIGRDVRGTHWPALLTAGNARSEHEAIDALEAACRAHLLEESGARAYRFTHDVIREVVEGDLSTTRRMLLHLHIARALEQGGPEPPVEEVAYHYGQTEEHARAAHWLERAGDMAVAGFANAAALERYVAARGRLVACAAEAGALSRLDEKLGYLRLRLGEYAGAREDFARAREGTTEVARRAELWRQEGLTWTHRGDYIPALAAFDAAETEGTAAGTALQLPGAARLALALNRAEVYHGLGNPDAREEALEQARALLRDERLVLPTDHSLHATHIRALIADQADHSESWLDLGYQAWSRRDFGQAEEYLQRELADREHAGDQGGIATSWLFLGQVALVRAAYVSADECFRHCLAIAERIGDQMLMAWSTGKLGDLDRHRGRLAYAEEHFRHHQALAEQIGDRERIGFAWKALGDIALDRGELVQAETCFRRGLAVLEEIRHKFGVAECWSNLGWVACERGDLATAACWCREARRLALQNSEPDMAAHAIFVHVSALLRGHISAPRVHAAGLLLARARALIGTPGWMRLSGRAALLNARLALGRATLSGGQELWSHAQTAAEEAWRLAHEAGIRQEEALAGHLRSQVALGQGNAAEAKTHARTALVLQVEMGTALEAARTRLVLAQALVAGAAGEATHREARALLVEAQVQFATSGAALDVAKAAQLARAWGVH